jgi:hypothetical protein
MTHDSFSVSEGVVAQFQAQCGCTVQFLKSGDTGLALNKAILSKNNPLADVFYGVDNTFLSRGLAGDIFETYTSPGLAQMPEDLRLDQQPAAASRFRLRDDQLRPGILRRERDPLPATLRDLTDPRMKTCWSWRIQPRHRPAWPSYWQRSPPLERPEIIPTWISGGAAGERCTRHRGMGGRVLRAVQRQQWGWRPADRR